MNKYNELLNMESENSLSILLKYIKDGTRVLEFGCAYGRMTKYLSEQKKCTVDIVEIDDVAGMEASKYANLSCIGVIDGDINTGKWMELLKGQQYDYIVFADVLEHLMWPEKVLRNCGKYLKEDGSILLSVPNIAHNAVLIELMNNQLKYRDKGILDDTHIRFFTYNSLKTMIQRVGYQTVVERATFCPVEYTELNVSYDLVDQATAKVLKHRQYGNAYQFIFELKNNKYVSEAPQLKDINLDGITDYKYVIYLKNDLNEQFTENFKLEKYFTGNKLSETIHYESETGIQAIRLDPINANCLLRLNKLNIELDGEIINCLDTVMFNGEKINDEVYLFNTNDPQFYIEFPKKTQHFILCFEYELLEYDNSFSSFATFVKQLCDTEWKNKCILLEEEKNALNRNNEESMDIISQKDLELEQYRNRCILLEEEKNVLVRNNEESMDIISQKELELEQYRNRCILLEEEKNVLVRNNEESSDIIAQKELELVCLKEENASIGVQKNELATQVNQLNHMYSATVNSTCWKVTKPIRMLLDTIKNSMSKNKYTFLFYKGLRHLKNNGIHSTINKMKIWNAMRKANKEVPPAEFFAANVDEIIPLTTFRKSIAVHVHLYYEDLIDEFVSYLNNIPYPFDLYVSVRDSADRLTLEQKFRQIENIKVIDIRVTINRGRDIAPLYVQFGPEIEKHDYFLHVHSKKSLFTGKEQYGWRQHSLDSLLGNKELIEKIFSLFEDPEKKVGLFFPETFGEMHCIAQDWLANSATGKALLESMNIEFDNGLFNYPVGSFFWAKMDAVRPFFDKHFVYEDFPEEAGQTDGTLAHALERAIAFVVRSEGYQLAIYDRVNGHINLGRSLKPYQDYFALTSDAVQYHLSLYDLVSFDIFDTLITRRILMPDDIFELMKIKIKNKYDMEVDYLSIRKRAEQLAVEKKHAYCNIHDIYNEISVVDARLAPFAAELKQMEIELELELCIPRKEMLKVFNHVKACGRKIVLVSDMYLTKDIIEKMLSKCGYEGYDDIWISCEKGARKDDGTIWNTFFDVYGAYNTIHVGDNPRSDIQIVGDRQKMTFYIMNPVTSFKLSKYYGDFKKYINTSWENSLLLGMIINEQLFNSPFSQGMNGEPIIDNAQQIGFVGFAPFSLILLNG